MLLFPSPPSRVFQNPSCKLGAYAKPARGAKLWNCDGESVDGIPGSPGTTSPGIALGYKTDCSPGTTVWISLYFSHQGIIRSQRRPKFKVRLGRARQLSSAKAAPYRLRR